MYRPIYVLAYIWALHAPMYIFCMHICEFDRIRENFHGQLASIYSYSRNTVNNEHVRGYLLSDYL